MTDLREFRPLPIPPIRPRGPRPWVVVSWVLLAAGIGVNLALLVVTAAELIERHCS